MSSVTLCWKLYDCTVCFEIADMSLNSSKIRWGGKRVEILVLVSRAVKNKLEIVSFNGK